MAVYFGTNKILDNGVAGTSLVLAHAQSHAASGDDPLTPQSIGAAPAEHTHDYAAPPSTQVVTLPQSGWTVFSHGCVQTIMVPDMRAATITLIASHPESYDAYMGARVYCAVQGWGALTFSAKRLPTKDLLVNVITLG